MPNPIRVSYNYSPHPYGTYGGPVQRMSPVDPAAGLNFLFVSPIVLGELVSGTTPIVPLKRSFLQSVYFELRADATAANRGIILRITDLTPPNFVFYISVCPTVQVASERVQYCFAPGNSSGSVLAAAANRFVSVPMSIISLPSAFEISSQITNIQAADQITGVQIYYEAVL